MKQANPKIEYRWKQMNLSMYQINNITTQRKKGNSSGF